MISLLLENMYPELTMSIPNLNVFDDDSSIVKVTVALNFDI